MSVLEEKVRVSARLPVEPQDTKSIHLIDGMAVVQTMKSGNASTFGELANKFYAIATEPLLQNGCDRVDIVFDQYRDMSIKSHERSRRGSSSALEVKINSPSTPVPKQWAKYISNPESIIELTTCNCKKSLCRSTCSCANNGLCCTEACFCMAEPGSCLNPHSNTYQDSDSEEEDDTP
ncbi:hypothetical protein ABFA07_008623 [Porites harrisoni]